jgi:hypothetical protein
VQIGEEYDVLSNLCDFCSPRRGAAYLRDRQALTREGIAIILLLWLLVIGVGLGGIMAFIGHTVFASSTAASIGWPAGNSFQTEVAVANLAVGCLGVRCYWFRDNFWVATVLANSVFQLGAAVVHINQIMLPTTINRIMLG